MSRLTPLGSPLLLGFDEIQHFLDRAGNGSGEGYPPYNIERFDGEGDAGEQLRITLAVAGFKVDQLSITLEHNQLTIRGHQSDEQKSDYLHRGIAARQFQRTFVLADGIKVINADLKNGLLSIALHRPQAKHQIIEINIIDLG
ncbi:MAG: Hsp20 family protein [bacterium]|nr:Hsp20 family protein [bacterium]